MAEIEIERRPRPRRWPWLVLLLVLVAAGVGAYFFLEAGDTGYETTPAAETRTPIEPGTEPPADLRQQPVEHPDTGRSSDRTATPDDRVDRR